MQRLSGLPEATWPLHGGIGIGSQVVKPESFKRTVVSWDLCSHFSDEENETQGGQRLPPGNTGQGWDEAEAQSSGPLRELLCILGQGPHVSFLLNWGH